MFLQRSPWKWKSLKLRSSWWLLFRRNSEGANEFKEFIIFLLRSRNVQILFLNNNFFQITSTSRNALLHSNPHINLNLNSWVIQKTNYILLNLENKVACRTWLSTFWEQFPSVYSSRCLQDARSPLPILLKLYYEFISMNKLQFWWTIEHINRNMVDTFSLVIHWVTLEPHHSVVLGNVNWLMMFLWITGVLVPDIQMGFISEQYVGKCF